MGERRSLKIGIIGCGSLGLHHAQNIQVMSDVDVLAVSSHRLESAQHLARTISSAESCPATYDDHNHMLAEQALDAVIVVTPNHTHRDIVQDVAAAGMHICCEKPLALSVKDCDEMIAAANANNVYLMTAYLRRFDNTYRMMRQLIEGGKIGKPLMAQVQLLYHRSKDKGNAWLHDRSQYGGLYSFYSHDLDQLTWMLGDVADVQAMMKFPDGDDATLEESVTINLSFQSGLFGTLTCSRIYAGGRSVLGISGTDGTLQIIDGELSYTDMDGKTVVIDCVKNDAYQEELFYFFNCIRENKAPNPSGWDGRRTLVIAAAAEESAKSGRRVSVVHKM